MPVNVFFCHLIGWPTTKPSRITNLPSTKPSKLAFIGISKAPSTTTWCWNVPWQLLSHLQPMQDNCGQYPPEIASLLFGHEWLNSESVQYTHFSLEYCVASSGNPACPKHAHGIDMSKLQDKTSSAHSSVHPEMSWSLFSQVYPRMSLASEEDNYHNNFSCVLLHTYSHTAVLDNSRTFSWFLACVKEATVIMFCVFWNKLHSLHLSTETWKVTDSQKVLSGNNPMAHTHPQQWW